MAELKQFAVVTIFVTLLSGSCLLSTSVAAEADTTAVQHKTPHLAIGGSVGGFCKWVEVDAEDWGPSHMIGRGGAKGLVLRAPLHDNYYIFECAYQTGSVTSKGIIGVNRVKQITAGFRITGKQTGLRHMFLIGGGWYRIKTHTKDWNPKGDAWGGYVGYGMEHATSIGTFTFDPLVFHISSKETVHVDLFKMGFTLNVL